MKLISQWGSENRITTRWIIAACHIFLGIAMLVLGVLLFQLEWQSAQWMYLIPAHLFLLAFVLYPNKRQTQGLFRYSYWRQKSMDITLIVSACLAIAIGTNYLLNQSFDDQAVNGKARLTAYTPEKDLANLPAEEVGAPTKKEQKQLFKTQRKKIRAQLKSFKKSIKANKADTGKGGKILLTVLVIFLAMVVAYFLAFLACSLSCSGMEALAIVVILVGAAALIWGCIYFIKRIWNRYERKVRPKKDDT